MSDNALLPHQKAFIDGAMSVGALKFGSFTLKSGRVSPYFFNAGLLSTGSLIGTVAAAYATLIAQLSSEKALKFDVVFGPAYKGIPFAASTALVLHRDYGIDVGYAYDRKEAKDHGEGGVMVGADVKGKRVLILDDVMTAGTAIRASIDLIRKQGGVVVGVVLLLDREEMGPTNNSTIQDVEAILGGKGTVNSIVKMRDLVLWLENNEKYEEIKGMSEYWNKYGIKE